MHSLSLDYEAESRPVVTAHFVFEGSLTFAYPEHPDPNVRGQLFTYGPGARIDMPAHFVYEFWASPGCTHVIGIY